MSRDVLSVLVEDKPGVLARVAGLFARRGFNVESLAVGPTEVDGVSRMTIVVNLDDQPLAQVIQQLDKLIDVIAIEELSVQSAVERELILVKVRCQGESRERLKRSVNPAICRVVDETETVLTIEAAATPTEIQALLTQVREFGITELVQSGVVAMGRGPRAMTEFLVSGVED